MRNLLNLLFIGFLAIGPQNVIGATLKDRVSGQQSPRENNDKNFVLNPSAHSNTIGATLVGTGPTISRNASATSYDGSYWSIALGTTVGGGVKWSTDYAGELNGLTCEVSGSYSYTAISGSSVKLTLYDSTTALSSQTLSPTASISAYAPISIIYPCGSTSTISIQAISTAVGASSSTLQVKRLSFARFYAGGNVALTPNIVKFTSGSGTYTPTPGTSYIRVRMVGGGGGGAGGSGSAAANGGAGNAGGATTFGTSLLVANGGNGGATNGGAGSGASGGTASVSSPAIGTALSGGGSGSPSRSLGSGAYNAAGLGGSSAFGGAGAAGGVNGGGGTAQANTGSGGGGGGGIDSAASNYGSGGGAGGFVDAIINNPTTVSYTIGGGGGGGSPNGGSSGSGGAGGSGYIEITEYVTTPVLNQNAMFDSTGLMMMQPLGGCPSGTLLADGSTFSQATYPRLFALYGTTTLPDMRNVFARGANASARTIGGISYPAIPLGTTALDQMQGHIHNFTINGYNIIGAGSGAGITGGVVGGGNSASYGAGITYPASDGSNGTPRTGSETRPVNLGVNYCIVANGVVGMPVQAGSVSSNTQGQERVERAIISGGTTPTVSSQSGAWISSITRNSVGDFTLNFSANTFSSAPACTINIIDPGRTIATIRSLTSTAVRYVLQDTASSFYDMISSIICMGAR